MKFKISIIFFSTILSSFFFLPLNSMAQRQAVMIVLDASGSMAGDAIETAKKGIVNWVSNSKNISEKDIIGFRFFGGRCNTSMLAIKPKEGKKKEFTYLMLKKYKAGGGTPLNYALQEAINDLSNINADKKNIVVFTDGEETCGGDPCATAELARQKDTNLNIFLVSLGNRLFGSPQAKCISDKPPVILSKNSKPEVFAKKMDEQIGKLLPPPLKTGDLVVVIKDANGNPGNFRFNIKDSKGNIVKKSAVSGIKNTLKEGEYFLDFQGEEILCIGNSKAQSEYKIKMKGNVNNNISCQLNIGTLYADYLDGDCNSKKVSYEIKNGKGNSLGTSYLSNTKVSLVPGSYTINFHSVIPAVEKDVSINAGQTSRVTVRNFGKIEVKVVDPSSKPVERILVLTNNNNGKYKIISSNTPIDVFKGTYDIEIIGGCGSYAKNISIEECKLKTVNIRDCCNIIIEPGTRLSKGNSVYIKDLSTKDAYYGKVGEPIEVKCGFKADIKASGMEALDINIDSPKLILTEDYFH